MIREYPDTEVMQNTVPLNGNFLETLCLISPDRRTIIMFEYYSQLARYDVYRIVYGDEAGMDCFAVRPIPILRNTNVEGN
jgi:hypothetical protein